MARRTERLAEAPGAEPQAQRLLRAQGCTNMRLRRAGRALSEFYDRVMQPAGLHGNQFTLLIPPYLKPDMTISELAEYAGLDRTTLARNLKLLAARRLISVGPGKDQRTRLVRLTAAGRRAVQHALPLWERAQHQVEESLGRAQLTALHAHLDTLEHALPMPCSD